MSEYDPTGLRTQADELRLYDLLAHWPEVLDSPLVAQAGPGRLRVPADTARGPLAALRPRVQQAWRDQLRAGSMPDFDPDEPFGTPRSCLSCASRPPSGGLYKSTVCLTGELTDLLACLVQTLVSCHG